MDDTLTSLLANMVSMVERLNQLDDLRGEQIKQLHVELADLRDDVYVITKRIDASEAVLPYGN